MVLERCVCSKAGLVLATVLLVAAVPKPAFALTCGTALNPLSVSATGVNFGVYDPASGSPNQATGTVRIACDLALDVLPAFSISLSKGSATQFSPRTMILGRSTLFYDLYTTDTRTTIWGDGSSDTEAVSHDGLVVLGHVELTIYGSVPTGQFVAAGAYGDTIVVTIEY